MYLKSKPCASVDGIKIIKKFGATEYRKPTPFARSTLLQRKPVKSRERTENIKELLIS
jgi:hypothetical protein